MASKKVLKQLADIQKGCSVRLLKPRDIDNIIAAAEDEAKKVPPDLRPLLRLEWQPWAVARAYGHRAEGTAVYAAVNKAGKMVNVEVGRTSAGAYAVTRFNVSMALVDAYISDSLGITRDSDIEKHNAARTLVLQAVGANPQWTIKF